MSAEEKQIKKPGTGAKIFLGVILLLFILFLVEGIASVVLYQQTGQSKLATIEIVRTLKAMFTRKEYPVNIEPHILVRPDSSKDVNSRIADEAMKSNRFVQDSWVEFRNMDFNGSYMHMAGPNRLTLPDAFFNPQSKDTI